MTEIFHDTNFWVFMASVVGCIKYLMYVGHGYKMRAQADKKEKDSQLAIEKAERDSQLLISLNEVVTRVVPLVEKHSKSIDKHESIVNQFETTAQKVFNAETSMTGMVGHVEVMTGDLTNKIINLSDNLVRTNVTVQDLVPRLEKIETVIMQLKPGSGNVYVTSKKS